MIFFQPNIRKSKKEDSDIINEYLKYNKLELLGILYERYMHLVYGVCLKYLNNKEDAKDAVIQIFEKLIIEVKKYEIKNFKSWLYVLAKNFCLMELRKTDSKERKKISYFEDGFMESTQNLHPIDETDNNDLNKALNNCIEKLKDEQKENIKLFYYENKCYQEIADQLNLNINKVKSYIQNGKRNLKLCIENNLNEQDA